MHTNKPRGLGKRAWFLTRTLRTPLIGFAKFKVFRAVVYNRAAVPKTGSVIIACNHISLMDPIFLWGALRRNAVAIAMAELWKTPVVGWVMRSMGHIPVARGDINSGKKAIDDAATVLEHDGVVIIFPEGKCASGDTMLPLKSGIVHLARKSDARILPAGIKGTNNVLPLKSRRINRSAQVTVRFGELIDPDDFEDDDELLATIEAAISDASERPSAHAARP